MFFSFSRCRVLCSRFLCIFIVFCEVLGFMLFMWVIFIMRLRLCKIWLNSWGGMVVSGRGCVLFICMK